MRAIEISQFGSPEVLVEVQREIPHFSKGEVLIRVHAAGVNRPDVLQRKGFYPPPKGASDIPGLEVSGEIVDGDLRGSGFEKGDVVCALLTGGGYAEYCVAPTSNCLPIPNGMSSVIAAAIPETYFTVWSNLFDRAALSPSKRVLIQGGASGIGTTAVQLASVLGCEVFATAGSQEKCRKVEELGATYCFDYRSENLAEQFHQLIGEKGVDVILDIAGAKYLDMHIDALADDGCLVVIGLMSGVIAPLDLGKVLRKRLCVTGSALRPRSVEFKAQIAKQLEGHVWPLFENKMISPIIHATFPLSQAPEAHRLMESREHFGKIVLEM